MKWCILEEVVFFFTDKFESELGLMLFSGIWKHTIICNNVFFFYPYFLAASLTNWAQISTGMLFNANVWDTAAASTLNLVDTCRPTSCECDCDTIFYVTKSQRIICCEYSHVTTKFTSYSHEDESSFSIALKRLRPATQTRYDSQRPRTNDPRVL